MLTAGAGDLVAGFQAVSLVMLALLTSGFAISSALRPRGEEDAGHAEAVLATATSRTRWLLGHVAVTVAGSVAGAGGGRARDGRRLRPGDRSGRRGPATHLADPGLAARRCWCCPALTRLLHGLRPRLATLGWLGLGYAVVVLVLAEVLQLPDWLRDLSPFEHLALVPAADFDPAAFAGVLGVAALLGLTGWLAFTRRDIG